MYQIENTPAAIKELQRLLRINQTSRYDRQTQNAVRDIQSRYGLTQTGIADYDTFNYILDEFHRYENMLWNSEYLFNPKFPYVEGDIGINVEIINNALAIILKDFFYEGLIPRGKFLSNESITAAKFLSEKFNYNISEEIDEALMNRILLELNAIEIKEKFS